MKLCRSTSKGKVASSHGGKPQVAWIRLADQMALKIICFEFDSTTHQTYLIPFNLTGWVFVSSDSDKFYNQIQASFKNDQLKKILKAKSINTDKKKNPVFI